MANLTLEKQGYKFVELDRSTFDENDKTTFYWNKYKGSYFQIGTYKGDYLFSRSSYKRHFPTQEYLYYNEFNRNTGDPGPVAQTEPSPTAAQTEPSTPAAQTEPSTPAAQTEPSPPAAQTETATTLRNQVAAKTDHEMNNDDIQKLQSDASKLRETATTLRNQVAAETAYGSQNKIESSLRQLESELRTANVQISKLNDKTNEFRGMFDSQFLKKSGSNGGSKARSFRLSRKRSKKHKYYKKKSTMKQKSKRRRSSRR